jgi:two-component system, OmpR family, sensor kinase
VRLRAMWRALTEPSLTRRLLLAQMGLLVALWLASIGYFIYDTAYVNDWYEPRQMRERADMILSVIDGMADRPAELRRALTKIDQFQRDENRENDAEGVRVSLNAWLGDQLLYATPGRPGVVKVSRFDELETSVQNGRRIRSFARSSASSAARVVVILPADAKSVFFTFWANGIVLLPLLVSMPLLLVPALVSVWLALRPFRALAAQVASKGEHDLEPLAFRARHRELRPLVRSVNDLLRRIREGLLRERRFVADAAHELRTPIAAVGLNTEAMQERMADPRTDPAATRSLLASLASSSQRASRLVAQLLSLMRSDAPRAAGDPQTVQALGERAQECLAAAAPLARHTDVDLELQCAGSGPYVRGDRESLDSLLQNLIENAIKYSPHRGRVLVGIEPAAAGAVLTVSDEGPGIPAEFHERVFERFYRVPSQSHAGSGLGLAIVKSVADRLGATVAFATPPWGHGLQVRVVFAHAAPVPPRAG